MPISKTIAAQLENASWIRRMFEEGVRLKRERGADAIFDFSLGNPDVEPPPAVLDALRRVAAGNRPGSHGYMPNPGKVAPEFDSTRFSEFTRTLEQPCQYQGRRV